MRFRGGVFVSLTCIVDSTSCYLVPELAAPTAAKKEEKQTVERKEDNIRTQRERERIVGKEDSLRRQQPEPRGRYKGDGEG